MRIQILSRSFELTEAIEAHVESRLRLALGTAGDQIGGVTVRLADVNANRGGTDKRCHVVVLLRSLGSVVVESTHADLYAAVDDVAHRAKEAVWRHLKRRRTLYREYATRPLRRQLA